MSGLTRDMLRTFMCYVIGYLVGFLILSFTGSGPGGWITSIWGAVSFGMGYWISYFRVRTACIYSDGRDDGRR